MSGKMVRPDPAVAAALQAIMANLPTQPGKMFGSPCYKVGGRMALGVFGDGVVLKLGEARSRELIDAGRAQPFEPMPGRVWREWVLLTGVPGASCELFAEAVDHVRRHAGA